MNTVFGKKYCKLNCVCICVGVLQIGAANPRIQRVLDALDTIKTKVKTTVLQFTKHSFAEEKCADTVPG